MAESLTPKQRSAIDRVSRNPDLQPLLFKKAKGLKWFDSFFKAGFFKPEYNPKPIPGKEEGLFSIPFWPITEYMVSTSPELSDGQNKDYAIKYLDVIKNVTSYAQAVKISNFRTWLQFAKIIAQIPANLILIDDLSIVDYWLQDPFERGMVARELGTK